MDSQKEQINITADPELEELTIRHGEAVKPINLSPVRIEGHIDAPFNYYRKRAGTTFEKDEAHLEVNAREKAIILYCDPLNPIAPVISGSIKQYPPLAKLGINNGDKTYSKDELKQVMKRNRFLFADSSECSTLVSRLANLEVSVEQDLKDADDDRGNRSKVLEQHCQSDLPETITLDCPIFVEGDAQQIKVDICYNVSGSANLTFWLESPTLHEMIEEQTTAMIADTVADFDDEIVIIYQ